MNENCNQKNSKKDVCFTALDARVQTKFGNECLLYTSPKGKVTYMVSTGISSIFDNTKYKKFMKFLTLLENQLTEKLPFYVDINYITLEAFRLCIENTGYYNLYRLLGANLFYLINDISINKSQIYPEEIYDKYLYDTDLSRFNSYYENYKEIVLECFKRGYSTLDLYNLLYKNQKPADFIKNIYTTAIQGDVNDLKTKIACYLFIEYYTTMSEHPVERTCTELYNKMKIININFGDLTDDDISHSFMNIDSIFNILE